MLFGGLIRSVGSRYLLVGAHEHREAAIAVYQTNHYRCLAVPVSFYKAGNKRQLLLQKRSFHNEVQDRNRMDNIGSRCRPFIVPHLSCDATPAAWEPLHLKRHFLVSLSGVELPET